jgi:BON domain
MGYFGPKFGVARNSLSEMAGGAHHHDLFRITRMIATAIESTEPGSAASSDLRTQAAVAEALASSQYAALRRLDCRVTDGVVEISGIVSSYYLKQLAQAAVLQLHQARSVRNLVEVEGETSILVATHCGAHRPSGA